MNRIWLLSLLVVGGPAVALATEFPDPTAGTGQPRVVVDSYHSNAWVTRPTVWLASNSSASSFSRDLGESLARSVESRMVRVARFVVLPPSGNSDAEYVVSGTVDALDVDTSRDQHESSDKKKRWTTWDTTLRLQASHRVQRPDGTILLDTTTDSSASMINQDHRPDDGDLGELLDETLKKTAVEFVGRFIPERQGTVTALGPKLVEISLGTRDGLAPDVDVQFLSEDLQPVTAHPSSKHVNPALCLGRPVQIFEDHALVSVGYRGAGGFLGLSTKLKANDNCLAAVQVGQVVRLIPHVG